MEFVEGETLAASSRQARRGQKVLEAPAVQVQPAGLSVLVQVRLDSQVSPAALHAAFVR